MMGGEGDASMDLSPSSIALMASRFETLPLHAASIADHGCHTHCLLTVHSRATVLPRELWILTVLQSSCYFSIIQRQRS